jgi:nicotinate dehydrogenase subunit B
LLVLLYLEKADAQQAQDGRRRGGGQRAPKEISAWIHVGEDGTVTAFTGKVEIGQNARTSLTQVVAEELPLPLSAIQFVMGDTDLTPYDAGTFGSRTTPDMVPQIRKAAAAAREALIDLAAERWNTRREDLKADDGKVIDRKQERSLTYGQLTHGQAITRSISDKIEVTPPNKWKITGTSAAKVDGRAFVTGERHYTSDLKLPGMLHGKVLRPPSYGATLVAADTKAAERLPGVVVVRDGNFLGVAAPGVSLAEEAWSAMRAEWKFTSQASDRDLFDLLKKSSSRESARPGLVHQAGSNEEGLSKAAHRLQQTYHISYIAHVPLEPRAALAEWKGDKLTVWTGTQRPFGVRSELAQALQVPEANVRVIMPDTGSGYGGKHTGETAVEAARLARGAGKPVKLVWTRQEEFAWAYFRPAGVIEVSSGMDKDARIVAWEFHNHNSGAAGIRPMYDFPNQANYFHHANSPLRQGSYRALAAAANHFLPAKRTLTNLPKRPG